MASLLIGGAAGLAFGPVGFLVGSYVGNLLFPQKAPVMSNLKLQGSDYGQMIPLMYGNFRVPGNVVWTTDLIPSQQKGKGGAGPEVEVYSASFQCLLCDRTTFGPIVGLNHIWADGTMIYDVSGIEASGQLPCALYLGTETQGPDPTIEAVEGVGNVPGFRGMAYAVFDNWPLANYGNRIPNLTFDVRAVGAETVPITRLAQNYTKPIAYARPQVTQWTYPGDLNLMRVAEVGSPIHAMPGEAPLAMQLYNQDLSYNSVGTPTYPTDFIAQSGTLPTSSYEYVGGGFFNSYPMFVNRESLRVGNAVGAPVIGSYDLQDGNPYPTGTDYAALWGIPVGVEVFGFVVAPDQSFCYVMGAMTGVHSDTFWFVQSDGMGLGGGSVTFSGTCNSWPTAISSSTSAVGIDVQIVATVEQNGNWFWVYENFAGTGEIVLWNLSDALVLSSYTASGIGSVGGPGQGNGGCVYSPGEGYAVVVTGSGELALFTRFGPNTPQTVPLSAIVADLCTRAGLTTTQYDVSQLQQQVAGYCVSQQQACRDSITPLQSAYYFDAVESSGVLKFVPRGGNSALTIPTTDLAAQSGHGGDPPPTVTVKRSQEVDLPAILWVTYANPDNDYQTGTQMSQRQVTQSQLVTTVDLTSIALEDSDGKQIAGTLLVAAWLERMQFTILVSFQYANLEPTDCIVFISAAGQAYFGRIMQKSITASNVIQLDIVATLANVWTQSSVGGSGSGFNPTTPPPPLAQNFVPLNLPLITDTDPYPNGFYAADANLVAGTFVGCVIWESVDGGATYDNLVSIPAFSVIGTAGGALGVFNGGNVFDHINRLEIVIGINGGSLASNTYLGVLNGANICVVGQEVLQFMTATLISAGVYEISDLLRGRRGTEWATSGHVVGETFVLLPVSDCNTPVSDLGQTRLFKAVPTGGSVATTNPPLSFVNSGEGLRCYSPTEVYGAPDASGDITINWTRRTRIGGEWADFTDVPLSEASESYVVQFWNANYSVCARVVGGNESNPPDGPGLISSPTFEYTAAMQTEDFGSVQETIYITVGQLGSFGLGTQTPATIAGNGASVTSPLNPVTPYNYQNPGSPPSGGCSGTVLPFTFLYQSGGDTIVQALTTGQTLLLTVPVPSSPNAGAPKLTVSQTAGAPTITFGVDFSESQCGPGLIPAQNISGATLPVTFNFSVGPSPNPATTPQLLPSTDYYVSITASGPCTVAAAFWGT